MMQVVLKSYGYYEGKIDGIFGNVSKQALISLQKSNNIESDGKIGPQTCTLLLNKQTIVKKNVETIKNIAAEGFSGLAIKADTVQMIDKDECIDLANQLGVFISSVSTNIKNG